MFSLKYFKNIKKFFNSAIVFLFIISFAFYSFGIFPLVVKAATITSAKDTLTRIKAAVTADHVVVFSLPTGVNFDSGDRLLVDFPSGFSLGGSWTTADFTFNDGTSRTVNAVESTASPNGVVTGCSDGANNVGVEIDTTNIIFNVIPCGGSFVASSNAATITFTILGTAGNGTLTNPSTGEYLITISNDEDNDTVLNDNVTIAVRIITDDQVVVTASVDPSISFSLGSNSVNLGTLTSSATGTGSHTFSVGTNGAGGFAVTYNGATLTKGSDTILEIGGTPATSSTGVEQFGINLRSNTTPSVGANVTTNSGTCSYASDYGTANEFAYEVSGSIPLANSSSAPADCEYTVSYIANISSATESGVYSTTITYIATGTF